MIEAPLEIDFDAFNSSRETLNYLCIAECDVSRMDFDFLTGFDQLNTLMMANLSNVLKGNWSRIPSLPPEIFFSMTICDSNLIDWNETVIDDQPRFPSGLENVVLHNKHFGDEMIDRILENLFNSTGETLINLQINTGKLTRLPLQLFNKKLNTFTLKCEEPTMKFIDRNLLNSVLFFNIDSGCEIKDYFTTDDVF